MRPSFLPGKTAEVAVYAYNTTDLLIDINGYFAAPGQGGYSFYPAAPCRVYDSRNNNGQPFSGERTVNIVDSPCAPPSNATGVCLQRDGGAEPAAGIPDAVAGWRDAAGGLDAERV